MASASLLTCYPEQRGLAETVCAPVSDQGEAERRGVQEVARLGLGLQRVVARDPGVPAKHKGSAVPEVLAFLPLGQSQLPTGAGVQEVVWSVGRLK